ncbi:MAG TPA: DUF3145 family protein [Candidatus Paceibacterota bacterium]|nr:DUF3145 family protein [Candidatus Paceibacterota bacterium]
MDLSALPPTGSRAFTRGYLVIHSAPSALCRHIEWAVASLLGRPVQLTWRPQPLLVGTHRTTIEWRDRAGIGAELASALRGWHYLRYEVREESAQARILYRFTPNLGIHRAVLDGAGSVMITENQITSALALDDDSMRISIQLALGSEWDLELEQFRRVEMDEISHDRVISF